jgi:subtilisin family serine protease
MIGEYIHVAIIDDFINECIFSNDSIRKVSFVGEYEQDSKKEMTHGTLCFGIINKYVIGKVMYSNLQVLNSDGMGNVSSLLSAIDWCIHNKVDVINVSLGSKKRLDYRNIKNYVDEAFVNGLIVVCAASNTNEISYPCALENTISVQHDYTIPSGTFVFNKINKFNINISACASHIINTIDMCEVRTVPHNSFAAPMITAYLVNILHENNLSKMKLSFNEILALLAKHASYKLL